MKTQNNKQPMMDAFRRARVDIVIMADWIADWIECEMEKHGDKVTWASVGSLEHTRENLIEMLEFLTGLEQSKIQSILDEQRK